MKGVFYASKGDLDASGEITDAKDYRDHTIEQGLRVIGPADWPAFESSAEYRGGVVKESQGGRADLAHARKIEEI